MTPRKRHFLFSTSLALMTLCGSISALESIAGAGGLMLHTRGVKTTARGGANIAGAEGAAAVGLNPAGAVAESDHGEFLVDLSYVRHDVAYTRLDSNLIERETVSNALAGVPIPTLALSYPLSDRVAIAAGLYAPYGGGGDYPMDGPQRYSLVSQRGSLLLVGELSLGVRLSDSVRVGVGAQNMYYKIKNQLAFSACPGLGLCNPEDPTFDMQTSIEQEKLINLSGIAGVQIDFSDRLRLGAAVQLPYNLSGTGDFQSTMPDLGLGIDLGEAEGQASVALTIPPSVRAGLEYRPSDRLSIELAASVEMWSRSKELGVTIHELTIAGLLSIDPGELGSGVPLEFRDTYALMAGVEAAPLESVPLTLMAGYAYETSAVSDEYMTVLTVDGNKHLFTGGFTLGRGKLRLHGVLGLARVADSSVDPDEGIFPQTNPILQAIDQPPAAFVNWGEYRSSWLVAGAGVSGTL